jgi:hypothetical protein
MVFDIFNHLSYELYLLIIKESKEHYNLKKVLKSISVKTGTIKQRLIELFVEPLQRIVILPHKCYRKFDFHSLSFLNLAQVEFIQIWILTPSADSHHFFCVIEKVEEKLVQGVVGVTDDQQWAVLKWVSMSLLSSRIFTAGAPT